MKLKYSHCHSLFCLCSLVIRRTNVIQNRNWRQAPLSHQWGEPDSLRNMAALHMVTPSLCIVTPLQDNWYSYVGQTGSAVLCELRVILPFHFRSVTSQPLHASSRNGLEALLNILWKQNRVSISFQPSICNLHSTGEMLSYIFNEQNTVNDVSQVFGYKWYNCR
jgi:hypothetical protein